jgi:hypothetical protein
VNSADEISGSEEFERLPASRRLQILDAPINLRLLEKEAVRWHQS